MHIAIIGAGIAGLTTAHVLARRHAVTLFEAGDYAGGHTHTVEVREGEHVLPVDTGFVVYNAPNYPNLCRLFERLGVAWRETDMSFAVSCERTGLEYAGTSLDALFAQRRNLASPRFWGMLRDILRFHRDGPRDLAAGLPETTRVAEYLRQRGYGQAFADHYLIPFGASVWSCDAGRFRDFPARFVIEFMANHRLLQVADRPRWRTLVGGSWTYVRALVAGLGERLRLGSAVRAVRRRARGVDVHLADGSVEGFDEAVLATHADESLALVPDADATEREVLGRFPYQANTVLLHTDTRLLPRNPRARASWNYRIPADPSLPVQVTYDMSRLQGLDARETYCVSLNPGEAVDPARVLRRLQYSHPLFRPGRDATQARHGELVRRRGLSYCGAYWRNGFHEDGVASALAVCAGFDLGLEP
jgi:predicted NAD/FAD-binding protein